MIYEPREDSKLLEKWVHKLVKGRVLDMGTGSGVQALAALKKTKDVLAVDINPKAVGLVKEKNVEAIESDLFENVEKKFDWIIFNPPYLPEDPREPEDSKLATTGGKEGSELLLRFLSEAKEYLKSNGKILMIVSSLTGRAENLFKGYDYSLLESEEIFMETLSVYLLEL